MAIATTTIVTTTTAANAGFSTAATPSDPLTAGFAAGVDHNAMTAQFHRLQAVAALHPDGAGGTYFDEKTGQLVVRYVQNADGARLKSKLSLQPFRVGEVAVRFEPTAIPMQRLKAATKRLRESKAWAGAHAASVHQVRLDELTPQIVIEASGDSEALVAAVVKATGLTPRVNISDAGVVEASRRADPFPYNGGLALWRSNLDANGVNQRTEDAFCTTGFRMTRGGTDSAWVTTAGHCATSGSLFWHDGWNLRVRSNYLAGGTDVSMLAGENGAYFSRYLWFGGRDTSNINPVTAKLTGWPAIGSAVYFSGANGGLVYGLVTATNNTDCNGTPLVVVDTDTGHTHDGAVLGGDSGGPAVRWNTATSATHDLTAEGIITCSNRNNVALFTPIHRVEAATGAVVVVGGT
ncbi:hypothetical protein [Allorhizocola rhizosphaerae]|uniref:hypothetical protein n=1 Tax=Allorhizocola rhizosphaerae TaxID=1872709 RepID=UPI000E3CCA7A|nr:hypothetical protein [Allorhizocola rhizosphaerae]